MVNLCLLRRVYLFLFPPVDALEDNATTSATAQQPSATVNFQIKLLRLVDMNLTRENDEHWQTLVRAMLDQLLSLGCVSEFTLRLHRDFATPSQLLVPPLLDVLPGCQTLRRFTLNRKRFDAIVAQALVQALPNLGGLDEIALEQSEPTPSECTVAVIVLRTALDGKVSQVPRSLPTTP